MDVRKVVVHPSLIRPSLLLGADRVPLLLSVLICASLVYRLLMAQMILAGIVAPALMWAACLVALQKAAKYDPLLFRVVWAARRYADHYDARSRIGGKPVSVPARWKR